MTNLSLKDRTWLIKFWIKTCGGLIFSWKTRHSEPPLKLTFFLYERVYLASNQVISLWGDTQNSRVMRGHDKNDWSTWYSHFVVAQVHSKRLSTDRQVVPSGKPSWIRWLILHQLPGANARWFSVYESYGRKLSLYKEKLEEMYLFDMSSVKKSTGS